ncbi:MAG: dehydrogenase [Verrucomicrobia bacterium]|nr:MAG: dehydrogenase [Verrucomicrobiota bacterium]
MMIRSRAPLRLGLAGGASDVSPFCDRYGGYVLNATIDAYACCHLEPTSSGHVEFIALDREKNFSARAADRFPLENPLPLHAAIYNRVVKEFNGGKPLSLKLSTFSDAPVGSGLGASSTLVVAMLRAYAEWLKLPLGEYDLARLAFDIERTDAGLLGGRQDQYAAAFGGFNFMEFYADERVIVNPLRIRNSIAHELESSMVLYYTGVSRESAGVIQEQKTRVEQMDESAIAATMELKQDALAMKEALLKSNIREIARVLGRSWEAKKKLASSITSPAIEQAYQAAMQAGAYSGRISGAGGGGFIIFMCDPAQRYAVIKSLKACGGQILPFHFSEHGAHAWSASP